jgi:hypothetical protein
MAPREPGPAQQHLRDRSRRGLPIALHAIGSRRFRSRPQSPWFAMRPQSQAQDHFTVMVVSAIGTR